MTDIGQFTDFLKGRLDYDSEQAFFDSLAADNGLRGEFRTFISIADSIHKNRKMFAPTPAQTEAVFCAVGLANPDMAAMHSPAASKVGFFGSKVFTILSTSIVTLIFSLSFAYFAFNSGKPGSPTGDISISSLAHRGIPVVTNIANDGIAKPNDSVKTIIKYIVVNNSPEPEENPAEQVAQQPKPEESIATLSKSELNRSEEKYSFAQPIGRPLSMNNPIGEGLINRVAEPKGLEIEFSGNIAWNEPAATISPKEYSPLHNLSLAVFYKFQDNLKAGVEVNQESFYAEYKGEDPDQSIYLIKQQRNFTTYSANIRYMPVELPGFVPYMQMGFGANEGGIVLKPSLGFEFRAYPELSFIVGAEYNLFLFRHQSSLHSASKIDFKYGISYNF